MPVRPDTSRTRRASRFRPAPRAGGALLFLGALGALAGPLAGQQDASGSSAQQAASQAAGSTQESPAPIPLDRAPRRLEQDMERIQRIEVEARREGGNERARADLDELLGSVNAVLDNLDSRQLDALNSAELTNYRSSLEREERRIAERTEKLQRRFAQLESDQQSLNRIRREWALTRESLRLDTLVAPSFEAGIERVLQAADSTEADLDSLVLLLLNAGEELASSGSRVGAALESISDMEELNRRMLLVRDAPPLWNPAALLAENRPWFGPAGQTAANEITVFGASLKADRARVLLHGLLFGLVLLLLLWLRGSSLDWPDDQRLEKTQQLLSRPYAAAALTGLLATNWIYPHASFLIFDLVLILTLIPVGRLLPPLVAPDRRALVYALMALFLLSRLTTLLPEESLAHRLALLGLAIGAALWAVVQNARMKASDGHLIQGRLRGPYTLAVRIGLGLALFSALCNVAGWVELAELIIQGLIPSAYTAIVVALGAMVLIAIVQGLALTRQLNRSRAFSENRDRVVAVSTLMIRFVAVLVWLQAMFTWFGADRVVLSRVRQLLTHEFSIGAVSISIGSVLLFGLILWLATWIGRIVRTLLRDDVLSRMSVSTGQADAWATLAQWAILVVGILFAAASAGIAGGQLAVLAGALGVGIGFGLQNIVNNFVSGFILIFEQPIKVGDKIEISSLSLLGEVRRIGIRSSTIRTFEGADVVVPNSNLIQSEVINWTLSDSKRRFQVDVGVKYGTDPQRVIDLLLEVAREHERVLKYPEPTALFMGFGDSALNFRLNMWSATFDEFFQLRSDMAVRINDMLKAEGIEIPFPQRDLHLRSIAPEARQGDGPVGEAGPDHAEPADSSMAPASED